LTPKDVISGTGKKVWWVCSRGHEWQATVVNRNRGRGCPFCHSHTSQLELRVFCEMKHIFKNVEHRKKFSGKECDVYIPELRLAIEVDGVYWHKNKSKSDRKKNKFFRNENITLLRIREEGLERLSNKDVFCSTKEKHFTVVLKLVKEIKKNIDLNKSSKIQTDLYLKRKKTCE